MPRTRPIRFAARSLASGDRTGIPPATAASKRSAAPVFRAIAFELRAVVRDDVLVRRDDRLAGTERGRDQGVRRFVAAHQLDDDVGVVRSDQVCRGVGEHLRRQTALAGRVEVPDGDRRQLQGAAVGRRQAIAQLAQSANHLCPDGSGSEDDDAQRGPAHRATLA